MGLLQIWAAAGALDAGDGRWRRSRTSMVAKDLLVIFVFSRGFRAYLLGQLSLFSVPSYLYVSVSVPVSFFPYLTNTDTFYQKKKQHKF